MFRDVGDDVCEFDCPSVCLLLTTTVAYDLERTVGNMFAWCLNDLSPTAAIAFNVSVHFKEPFPDQVFPKAEYFRTIPTDLAGRLTHADGGGVTIKRFSAKIPHIHVDTRLFLTTTI